VLNINTMFIVLPVFIGGEQWHSRDNMVAGRGKDAEAPAG
jgi:hypothetical protein